MVPEKNLYNNAEELLQKLNEDMVIPLEYTEKHDKNYARMIDFIRNH
jgi:hypothetical protein